MLELDPPLHNSERLLLSAATMDCDRAAEAWEEWQAENDLDAIDQSSFRLLPPIYHNLQSSSAPIPMLDRLRGISRYGWAQNQRTIRRLSFALDALRQFGVPVLMHRALGLFALRGTVAGAGPVNGIDLLVHSDNLEAAHRAMHAVSWTARKRMPPPIIQPLLGTVTYDHATYGRVSHHWHPYTVPCTPTVEKEIWRRSVQSAVEDRSVYRPDVVDLFVMTCLYDRRLDATGRLLWLNDAITIIRTQSMFDWESVRDRAMQAGLVHLVAVAALNLHKTLGIDVPRSLLDEAMAPRSTRELRQFVTMQGGKGHRRNTLRHILADAWTTYKECSTDHKRRGPIGFVLFLAAYYQYEWDLKHWWLTPTKAGQKLLLRFVRPLGHR